MTQTRNCPWKWNAKNSLGLSGTNWSPNSGQKTRLSFNKYEEKNLSSNEFCCARRSQSESENKRKQKDKQILGPCHRTEKVVEHAGDCGNIHNSGPWDSSQEHGKETGWTGY